MPHTFIIYSDKQICVGLISFTIYNSDMAESERQSPASSPSVESAQTTLSPPQPSATTTTTTTPISSLLAGIAGGSASTILLYPLDLIKVRMQVDERRRSTPVLSRAGSDNGVGGVVQNQKSSSTMSNRCAAATAAGTGNPIGNTALSSVVDKPRTICTTVRGVIRHEGYLGLYRGLTPAIIGSAASWGGFFILYEEIKGKMLLRKQLQQQQQAQLLADPHLLTKNDTRGGETTVVYDLTKDMHVDEEIDINTNDDTSSTLEATQQHQHQAKLGPTEHFSASCLAGACMVGLTNPLWLIKTRLQLQNSRLERQMISQPSCQTAASASTAAAAAASTTNNATTSRVIIKPPYKGLLHAAYTIVQEEGILALYKGSIPALMLVSHGGIQFVTYEFLKGHFFAKKKRSMNSESSSSSSSSSGAGATTNDNQLQKSSGKSQGTIGERCVNSLGYLVMGAVSKFVASTTTYPLQVIKARLQQRSQVVEMSETTGEIVVTKREYTGVFDCVKRILKNEGMNGFFKGCVTNAIRVAPSAAITFVTYEFVLDMLTE